MDPATTPAGVSVVQDNEPIQLRTLQNERIEKFFRPADADRFTQREPSPWELVEAMNAIAAAQDVTERRSEIIEIDSAWRRTRQIQSEMDAAYIEAKSKVAARYRAAKSSPEETASSPVSKPRLFAKLTLLTTIILAVSILLVDDLG